MSLLGHPILIALAIAVMAPMLAEIPLGFRTPAVVIEMALGIVVGPHVLGWVAQLSPMEPVALLGEAGLGFLFFLVGMDIDLGRFERRPLLLAVISWSSSLAAALLLAGFLQFTSLIYRAIVVALALTTTATGTIVPIVKDANELDSKFGVYLMAAATLGEFGPIITMAMTFAGVYSSPKQAALLLFFVVVAILMAITALQMRMPKLLLLFRRTLHSSNQLPVRICMLLLTFLMVLAGAFGIDAMLGAFTAGMVVGVAARGKDGLLLREKLDAIGFGYFVPFFFVTSGMRYDLNALFTSLEAMLALPLFLVLMLVVRGAPAYFYRDDLTKGECASLALYLSTALPLVVAITDIGVSTGHMHKRIATAMVGAAMVSTLVFPTIAAKLLATAQRSEDAPSGEAAATLEAPPDLSTS